MLSFEETPLDCQQGFAGRAFCFRSDSDSWSGTVFFAVASEHAALLTDDDDALLPLAAMLALVRREPLDMGGRLVDGALLRNVSAAIRQFSSWYPRHPVQPINNAIALEARRPPAPGVAVLFTSGIDSHYSILRHSEGRSARPDASIDRDVNYAVHVLHTREPNMGPEARDKADFLRPTTEALGVTFVPVLSNMMLFEPSFHSYWADIGHGGALATVFHMLRAGVGVGLIPSSQTYGRLMPWGSSPITDPLYGSTDLRIIHDCSTASRVEKTALVARSPVALANINVCDKYHPGVGYGNCSRCQKCLRTMVTLDLFGVANGRDCPSFDWSRYHSSQFSRVFLRDRSQRVAVALIRDAAAGQRDDIAAACDTAIRRSWWMRPLSLAETLVKNAPFGRKHREALMAFRNGVYRRLGMGK